MLQKQNQPEKPDQSKTPIYELDDLVILSKKIFTVEKNQDSTVFEIEEIDGEQYLTVSLVCLIKVPASLVRPSNLELHIRRNRK